jgi:hypothetical protein
MATSPSSRFTATQGQYLAFIHAYTLVNGRPPAEADMQRFFGVTPPSVHNMIVELERRGLITRVPRQPRSIAISVADDELPRLRQPIKGVPRGDPGQGFASRGGGSGPQRDALRVGLKPDRATELQCSLRFMSERLQQMVTLADVSFAIEEASFELYHCSSPQTDWNLSIATSLGTLQWSGIVDRSVAMLDDLMNARIQVMQCDSPAFALGARQGQLMNPYEDFIATFEPVSEGRVAITMRGPHPFFVPPMDEFNIQLGLYVIVTPSGLRP